MKKKLINYAIDLATSITGKIGVYCYKRTDHTGYDHYYTINDHIILETAEPIPGIEVNADNYHVLEKCKGIMRLPFVTDDGDYTVRELPTVEEIKKGIRDQVGRTRNRVAYRAYDDVPAVNARDLVKAMDAINAKKFFSNGGHTKPVFLFENDDPQSTTIIMILPIFDTRHKAGFWAC